MYEPFTAITTFPTGRFFWLTPKGAFAMKHALAIA